MSAEKQFEKILWDAIEEADGVDCDVETYREGLRRMIEEIRDTLQESEEMGG